jgi:hypothetical protein
MSDVYGHQTGHLNFKSTDWAFKTESENYVLNNSTFLSSIYILKKSEAALLWWCPKNWRSGGHTALGRSKYHGWDTVYIASGRCGARITKNGDDMHRPLLFRYGKFKSPPKAINHTRGVFHGSNKKSLFSMAKMRYFRGTGMIFPRLALL